MCFGQKRVGCGGLQVNFRISWNAQGPNTQPRYLLLKLMTKVRFMRKECLRTSWPNLVVGLDELRGLFQLKQFCDSS